MAVSFSDVSFHKGGVDFEAFVGIFETHVEVHELHPSQTSVGVYCFSLRVSLKSFVKLFESSWEVPSFEEFVSFLSMLLSDLRVDIVFRSLVLLDFLSCNKGHLDAMVLIFQESLLVHADSFIDQAHLDLSVSFTVHGFGEFNVIVATAALSLSDGGVTSFDTFVILLHLEEAGGLVGVETQLLGAPVDGLLVVLESLNELFLFVELITLGLDGFGLFLGCDSEPLVFWECCLSLFLLLLLLFLLSGGLFSCALLAGVFVLISILHLFLLEVSKVNSREYLEYVHKSLVRLHHLHEHLGVLLAHSPHAGELRVFEVLLDLWVGLEFGFSLWPTEHVAHATTRRTSHSAHARHPTAHASTHLSCHLLVDALDSLLDLSVVGVLLQTLFEGLQSFVELSKPLQSVSLPLIPLGPVSLDLNALIPVLQCLFVLSHIVITRRSVTIYRMVGRIFLNGLSVKLNCFLEVLLLKSLCSLFFS